MSAPSVVPEGSAPSDALPLDRVVLTVRAESERGLVRARNEDAAIVGDTIVRDGAAERVVALASLERALVLGVADGLGGHQGGAEASRYVAERVAHDAGEWPADWDADALSAAVRTTLDAAHAALLDAGASDAALAGLGTTFTALVCTRAAAVLAHVGDSRCYRLRDGVLLLLTRDHTAPAPLAGGGYRSVLTNSVGAGATMIPEVADLTRRLLPSDEYLLCTDGAADAHTPEDDLAGALGTHEGVGGVVAAALARGGADNITAVRVGVSSLPGRDP